MVTNLPWQQREVQIQLRLIDLHVYDICNTSIINGYAIRMPPLNTLESHFDATNLELESYR